MGKGGSASGTTAVERLGPLAATIPLDAKDVTKRSIRESIPPHLFKRSYVKSLGHVALDLCWVAGTWVAALMALRVLPGFCAPLVWCAYWLYQGINCTALWVLAHECGHGGFTDSRLVNDIVGWLLHSSLLTPYFSWAITHAKHHHYTNHMTNGETWVPSTASPDKASVKFAKSAAGTWRRIVVVALLGWYTYLLTNATGAKQNAGQSHFSPSARALFKPKDANLVRASNLGMLLMGGVLAWCVSVWGASAVCFNYLVPQTVCNFFLCAITFMQHTHEAVPHFDAEKWTWLRGALSTIDRSMGPHVDWRLHHIVDSHVVHHIFSEMPFYGAKEATPYVRKHLGVYYKSHFGTAVGGSEFLGYWKDFYECMHKAVVVGPGEDGFLWFR
mmetsp:Transcript_24536/g.80782  ORF Transcript_24536/g.80782 Transcript_24536/m.80782 type:complete len:387 (-) Transcript_24536:401-1561(-)